MIVCSRCKASKEQLRDIYYKMLLAPSGRLLVVRAATGTEVTRGP